MRIEAPLHPTQQHTAPDFARNWILRIALILYTVNLIAIVAGVVSGYDMGALTHRFEERQAITSISSNQLAATAVVAWVTFLLRRAFRAQPDSGHDYRFWAVTSAGFIYLMLDETFQFHEGMDSSFVRLFGYEFDPMLDGVPTAIYGIAAAAVCYWFRREILRYPASLPFFVAGGFFLAATSFLNMGMATSVQIVVEESAKLLGVVSFLLAHIAALGGAIREARSTAGEPARPS